MDWPTGLRTDLIESSTWNMLSSHAGQDILTDKTEVSRWLIIITQTKKENLSFT